MGEHLKARRLALGLFQKELAKTLGVSVSTLEHWERGRTDPATRFLPAIIRFLGADPTPLPATFAARLR